jgi:uncharacterized HAD superfamily protein
LAGMHSTTMQLKQMTLLRGIMMDCKTCIIDIDGVLNHYPDTFVNFVNEQLTDDERRVKYENLHEIKDSLPYSLYKTLKRKYRESGYKESLQPRFYSAGLLKMIKAKGYYVIILTARPIHEVNSLLQQTTNWLKRNNLEYDYLTFEKDKDLEILQKFKNISFAIDDNRAIANKIAKQGYKVFLVNNQYNQGELNDNVVRVQELSEIPQYI